MARYLSGKGVTVGVVDSSARGDGNLASDLNRGQTTGDEHTDPYVTRKRGVLGSAGLWNIETPFRNEVGRFVFPAPSDFDGTISGIKKWDLTREELLPFAQLSQTYLGVEDFDLSNKDGRDLRYCMEGYEELVEKWNSSSTCDEIVFLEGVTVTEIELDASGDKVVGLKCRKTSGEGGDFRLQAEQYVLALGVIENARLLMLSNSICRNGIGNHSGHLGQHYMDHTIDNSLRLEFPEDFPTKDLEHFDVRNEEGRLSLGYEKFDCGYRREYKLLNCAYTLSPLKWWIHSDEVAQLKRAVKGDFRGATFTSLLKGSFGALLLIKQKLAPKPLYGTKLFGWSQQLGWRRERRYTVAIVAEQYDSEENYLSLIDEEDAFGQKKVKVHWKWTERDAAALRKNKEHIRRRFEAKGIKVISERVSSVPSGSHHHFGSTRMARSPDEGVVDLDGKVHGIENLYVGGASLCTTCSFVNPTYIGMTMGLYVADRIVKVREVQNEKA